MVNDVNMKIVNIFCIAILIILIPELSGSGQSGFSEPAGLQKSYLKGSIKDKNLQCRNEIAASLGEECSFCHNDDVTIFTEKGDRAKEDMKASISIGVKCDYCHAGRGKFTDKFKTADKMFKLSEMMAVECDFCHTGKDVLTPKGKTARTAMLLQKWIKKGNKKCMKCHVEKKQFELNDKGKEMLECLLHE